LNTFDEILAAYTKQVGLPWAHDLPPAGRVWVLWYEKTMQRRFSGRIGEFEHATQKAGHGWHFLDLSSWFGKWIADHEFFDALVEQPEEIRGLLPDAEEAIINDIKKALENSGPNDVLALDGCGSLFGIIKVSTLIGKVAGSVRGRLVVGFPGKHASGIYRLLDARDGWNYHAVPIPKNQTN
jgi:hypothetical protein